MQHFICSLTKEHLGCFQVLVTMNEAAINLCMQVFVSMLTFRLLQGNTQECDSWASEVGFVRQHWTTFKVALSHSTFPPRKCRRRSCQLGGVSILKVCGVSSAFRRKMLLLKRALIFLSTAWIYFKPNITLWALTMVLNCLCKLNSTNSYGMY